MIRLLRMLNKFIWAVNFTMEVTDRALLCNRDWDPCYLRSIFDTDFFDFSELWSSSIGDIEIFEHVENVEKYSPIVEDISLDDSTLCEAVNEIEKE